MKGRITTECSKDTSRFVFAELKGVELYLDDNILRDTAEIMAILLGGEQGDDKRLHSPLCFLLIQPIMPGMFSRIGLLRLHDHNRIGSPLEFIQNPEGLLKSQGLSEDAVLDRKTVRIV